MTDTIVLGLDGANWELLEPWLSAGDLPNIAKLRKEGIWTDLESCLPPVTCPNWRCYSTGKNPGKLGVFWWERIDTEQQTLTTPNSRSFRSANFWDYCNDEGLSVGVMNLPMTYPPFDVDGFMIAGGPDSEQEEYTHPLDLGDELDASGYKLHPETPVSSKKDQKAAEQMVTLIDDRLKMFREQLNEHEVDVAHLTIFYVNVLQHFFWRGEPTKAAWEVIDRHIGEISQAYPEATLLLMSDHGCTDINTVFYVNSWLEEQGYLVTDEDATSSAFASLGINKERVGRLAHKLGIHGLVTKLTPGALKDRVPDSAEGFRREQKLDRVDWEESSAVASGQGLVYVIGDKSVRGELVAKLANLESDITGKPIAREVLTREDAYDGPYVAEAPDIVFDQQPGVHTSGAIGSNPVFDRTGQWEAENVRTGLFLAAGPDIVTDDIENTASITDVAPTVLHSVGCAIPTDVDGEPLPIFAGREIEKREPITVESDESVSDEEVQERLSDLGYLE